MSGRCSFSWSSNIPSRGCVTPCLSICQRMDGAHMLTSAADKLTEGHSQGRTWDSDPGLLLSSCTRTLRWISRSIWLGKDVTLLHGLRVWGPWGCRMWDYRGGRESCEPRGGTWASRDLRKKACAKGGGWADCRGWDPEPLCGFPLPS